LAQLNCKVLRSNRACVGKYQVVEIIMQLKFTGKYANLRECVSRTRLDGEWRELKSGHKQYRTDDGGYLNWWKTTGTLTFQGHNSTAKQKLIQAFTRVASAQGFLQTKPTKDLRDSNEKVEDLLGLVIEARILRRKLNLLINRVETISAASKW
jgi:hypothetical protein